MRITELERGYQVDSDSGRTYLVTEQSARYGFEYDNDYMQVWGCTCPAGQHRKSCKHVAAVIAYRVRTGTNVLKEYAG